MMSRGSIAVAAAAAESRIETLKTHLLYDRVNPTIKVIHKGPNEFTDLYSASRPKDRN